jgi:hypothetical protein
MASRALGWLTALVGISLSCSLAERRARVEAVRDEAPPVVAVQLPSEPAAAAAATASAAEPLPQAPPALVALEPEALELYAIGREVIVRQRPEHGSPPIGVLRLGARVVRSAEPEGQKGCSGGWYRITPMGYVCAGAAATIDPAHPALALARMPDRSAALPYAYGRAPAAPPRYTSLPATSGKLRPAPERWADVEGTPIPAYLLGGGALPRPHGYALAGDAGVASETPPNSGFALMSLFDHSQGRLGLSTDFELLPIERLERIRPSAFHGVNLSETPLPVAFVKARSSWLYSGEPKKGLTPLRQLGFREAVALSGQRVRFAGVTYLETRSGDWLKDERLVRLDPPREAPTWAVGKRTWVHVSVLQQSLVAYEGTTPVYATLVSTGVDGLGDPEQTHSTVRGSFLVHTKHVTNTMQGDEEDDEFLLADVPYVQYFHGGFALHAAYWHDAFGTPRSHGCVNLSPLDARWLFHWTEPPVPQAWHSALSLRDGTLVHVTP